MPYFFLRTQGVRDLWSVLLAQNLVTWPSRNSLVKPLPTCSFCVWKFSFFIVLTRWIDEGWQDRYWCSCCSWCFTDHCYHSCGFVFHQEDKIHATLEKSKRKCERRVSSLFMEKVQNLKFYGYLIGIFTVFGLLDF